MPNSSTSPTWTLSFTGLDVKDRVVRRRADDLDALHARDKIEAVTVIHAAHRDKRTAADAAILVVADLAEGVHAQLADRKARLGRGTR